MASYLGGVGQPGMASSERSPASSDVSASLGQLGGSPQTQQGGITAYQQALQSVAQVPVTDTASGLSGAGLLNNQTAYGTDNYTPAYQQALASYSAPAAHAPVASGSPQQVMQSLAAQRGWSGAQWQALNNVEMAEAGYNLTAKNPTSTAYGMAQFINGPGEYAQYGGNANTAAGQATAMLNYIAQRYGTPEAAWAHEQRYHWY